MPIANEILKKYISITEMGTENISKVFAKYRNNQERVDQFNRIAASFKKRPKEFRHVVLKKVSQLPIE
jgi:DNA-binding PadR family transcriptional regulator